MTYSNKIRSQRFRRALALANKTALLVLPMGFMVCGLSHHATAQTQASAPSCAAALDALMADWHYVGYAEPGKPSQMMVSGRHGYTTTAGHYRYMVQRIRDSARDCEAGRDLEARQSIAVVREAMRRKDQTPQFGD